MEVSAGEFSFLQMEKAKTTIDDHLMLVFNEYIPYPENPFNVRCLCGWQSSYFKFSKIERYILRSTKNHSQKYQHAMWLESGYFELNRTYI